MDMKEQERLFTSAKELPIQDESGATKRQSIFGWLRLGTSVILLLGLLFYVDLAESWRIFKEANVTMVVITIALFIGLRFYSAYRWFVLLKGKNPAIAFPKIMRLTFIGVFCATFMPGGAELARIYTLSKMTSNLALTVSSLLVERVLALIALFVLVLVGILIGPSPLPAVLGYAAWVGLVVVALGTLAIMHPKIRMVIDRLLSSDWIAPIQRRVAKLFVQLDTYANQAWLMVYSLSLAFGIHLLRVAITMLGAWALGVQLPVLTFVAVVPIIFFFSLLPISVGGLGVRETAFVSLFSLVGVSAEIAFTLSMLLYFISVLTTLPGAYFYAVGNWRPTKTKNKECKGPFLLNRKVRTEVWRTKLSS